MAGSEGATAVTGDIELLSDRDRLSSSFLLALSAGSLINKKRVERGDPSYRKWLFLSYGRWLDRATSKAC